MTPTLWRTLEDLFHHAIALDDDARAAFVTQLRATDPKLADQLERLLSADQAEHATLTAPIAQSILALAAVPGDPWIGRRLGHWTVMRRLGAGGMGVVFLAERSDQQFDQTAAIKIMSTRLLGSDGHTRFQVERQILAHLNHPNIASLIDGGATEDNLPYLVMEFVDGAPIDAYCDDQALSVPERLSLFSKVCDAVDYAHRNLVVHRDLKPSNIQVTTDGEPKLLDFGIAKLLEPGAYDLSIAETDASGRLMTPEYASPEQVRGQPASIASDVYALGVLLFRLLAGRAPYDAASTDRRALENAILDTEPKRPSIALGSPHKSSPDTDPISPEDIGDRRATSVKRLRRRLAGDLDNIVLKCLQKTPERRYATARELADDIARHLDQQPVRARGDHWTYTTGKFLRRRARPLAAATVAATVLVASTTYYTVSLAAERDRANAAAHEAQRAEAEAVRAAERAAASAKQADEVSHFLASTFAGAAPGVAAGEIITPVDLLNLGAERIETLADQPLVQADLYRVMGTSYTSLGEYSRANAMLERSVEILESRDDAEPNTLALSLISLGQSRNAVISLGLNEGPAEPGIDDIRRALTILETEFGPDDSRLVLPLNALGSALLNAGEAAEALPHFERAESLVRRSAGQAYDDIINQATTSATRERRTRPTMVSFEDDKGVADAVDQLIVNLLDMKAIALFRLGRADEGLRAYEEGVALADPVLGPYDVSTINILGNYSAALQRFYRYDDAFAYAAETVARARHTFEPGHPELIWQMRHLAWMAMRSSGNLDAGDMTLDELETMLAEHHGEHPRQTVAQTSYRGYLHLLAGRYEEAARELAAGRALGLEVAGPDDRWTLENSLYLGVALARLDRLSEAEERLVDGLTRASPFGFRGFHSRAELGNIYSRQGRIDEAETLLGDLIADVEDRHGADAPQLAEYLPFLAQHARRIGDLDRAEAVARRAMQIGADTIAGEHWLTALAEREYALALHANGRIDLAKRHAQSSRTTLVATFGPDHPILAELDAVLAG